MRSLLLLACAVLVTAPFAGRAQGFSVRARSVYELEMGTFDYLEINQAGEQFTLVPPRSWRAETDAPGGAIRFYAPKGKAILTVQFLTGQTLEALDSTESVLRQAAPHLEDAKVLEAFPAHGGDRKGKGIDLAFLFHGNAMRGRAAVIGLNRGYARLLLTCGKDDFKDYQQTFSSVLRSFQSAERLTAQK